MNLLQQARENMPLSPAERALLKAFQGLLITFVIAAVPVVWDAVTAWANGAAIQVSWGLVFDNALKAGLTAVGFVAWKYFSALQDTVNGKTTDVGHAQGQSSLRSNRPNAPAALATPATLAQGAQQLAGQLGLPANIVGDIASAVAKELGDRLGQGAGQGMGTSIAQIPAFQPFTVPDGMVIVKAPNGVSIPVPADALPPADAESGTSGPVTNNAVDTLSASPAPVAPSPQNDGDVASADNAGNDAPASA